MFNIKLTETQRKNLLIFLERVNLTGREAPAFMEIVTAINKAELSGNVTQLAANGEDSFIKEDN